MLRPEQRRSAVGVLRGECLCCLRLSLCTETSYERILDSYTCPLFEGVSEPVYQARVEMMMRYGAVAAISSMLPRHDPNPEGEK